MTSGESDPFIVPTSMPCSKVERMPNVVFHPALLSASPISFAESTASVPSIAHMIAIGSGLPRIKPTSFSLWATVSRRGSNSFWSLTRTSRSDSASFWDSAAFRCASAIVASNCFAVASADLALALESAICASNPFAIASALADSSWALATTASVIFDRAKSYFDTRSSNQPSPITPSTIRTHPTADHFFTQSRRGYSVRSIERVSQYFSSLDFRPYISHMSWTISGNSSNRPIPTANVQPRSQWKFQSRSPFEWSLAANSRAWAACAISGDPAEDRYIDVNLVRDLSPLNKFFKWSFKTTINHDSRSYSNMSIPWRCRKRYRTARSSETAIFLRWNRARPAARSGCCPSACTCGH